jgi:hypothetical protein
MEPERASDAHDASGEVFAQGIGGIERRISRNFKTSDSL